MQNRPSRFPDLLEKLAVKALEREPILQRNAGIAIPPSVVRRGPPNIPMPLVLFSLVTMIERDINYLELQAHLESHPICKQLGWLRRRGKRGAAAHRKRFPADETPIEVLANQFVGPSKNALHAAFGSPRLPLLLRDMIDLTARLGRDIDDTVLVDSHEIPTSERDNSRNRKFHGAKKFSPMVKVHFAAGKYSLLVSGIDVTLDTGRGSGDAPHLRFLLKQSRRSLNGLKEVCGDGAYGNHGNYGWCGGEGIRLFTLSRRNENRADWCKAAADIELLKRESPDEFQEHMRFRPKVEAECSRSIRRRRHMHARARKGTPEVIPTTDDDVTLCDLPDDELKAILQRATDAVGLARQNEALASKLRDNILTLIVLEQLHDSTINSISDPPFEPIRVVKERDIIPKQSAA